MKRNPVSHRPDRPDLKDLVFFLTAILIGCIFGQFLPESPKWFINLTGFCFGFLSINAIREIWPKP